MSGFHDLSQTTAGLYMGSGVDPIVAQGTLAYPDVTMTTRRCGHFSPSGSSKTPARAKAQADALRNLQSDPFSDWDWLLHKKT